VEELTVTRRILSVFTLLLLSIAFAASAADSTPGTITGTVAAKADGQPIAGATVTGGGASAVTDALGRFRLEGVAPGSVELAIEAAGFEAPSTIQVEVKAGDSSEVAISLDPSTHFMERIQVTATKIPLSIGELPAQADIIDRETIDLRGDQSLTQAIAHVPGLMISTFAGSFESVTLRGLPRDGNEFTSTLLMIDGVPQTDSRNSARVVNLPINDASVIEVLRGPSSALYGRTAIGGSVNLLTAEPSIDQQFGLDLTGGDFGTLKGFAHAGGPFADWAGYYVSGSDEESDGWYEGSNDVTVDRWALFGKLTFAPGETSSGHLTANVVDSDQGTPTNVPIIDGRLLSDIDPRFDHLSSFNLPAPNYHQDEDRYTGSYARQIARDSSLQAVVGYREILYQFIDDGDVIGSPFDLDAGTVTQYPFEQKQSEDIWYSELRFELGHADSTLLAGGSYESTSGFVAGNLIYTDEDTLGWPIDYLAQVHPPRSAWQFDRFGGDDYELGSTGIFAQYVAEPGDRWILMAGGRYDRLDLDNTRTFSAGQPHVAFEFEEVSPRLSATYKLIEDEGEPDLSLYASYSEAFLPPRRPSALRPADSVLDLEPEDIANWELGLKGDFAGSKLAVEAAIFQMEREGIVLSVRQGPFFLPTNSGEHEYEGFEASLRWTESSRFTAYVNAALYHNRFGHFVIESEEGPEGDVVLTGNRLPISPDEVWNAGTLFRVARAFDFAIDVKYVGDVMIDQNNTFQLDDYTLVDAAVSWTRQPIRLTLSASNLFDEEYFWSGDTTSGESADVGRPRMVLLTAAFSWNRGR
jgi:iron complex outermembrane receptor protein